MVLPKVRFHLPVGAIAVDGESSPAMRVGATGDGAAVYEIGVGCNIIVPAIPAVFRYERGDIVFFL